MKNAIILHGAPDHQEYYSDQYPSCSNGHWLPWLQKQLLIRDIAAATPEVPGAADPKYNIWRREFERFDITPDTILIGHSCGGGFITRWLCDNRDTRVGRVILVAPWIDPSRQRTSDFFDFQIDPDLYTRTKGLAIFHSDNDMDSIKHSVQILRDTLQGVYYREFHKYGHFCLQDMGTDAFPELLSAAVD